MTPDEIRNATEDRLERQFRHLDERLKYNYNPRKLTPAEEKTADEIATEMDAIQGEMFSRQFGPGRRRTDNPTPPRVRVAPSNFDLDPALERILRSRVIDQIMNEPLVIEPPDNTVPQVSNSWQVTQFGSATSNSTINLNRTLPIAPSNYGIEDTTSATPTPDYRESVRTRGGGRHVTWRRFVDLPTTMATEIIPFPPLEERTVVTPDDFPDDAGPDETHNDDDWTEGLVDDDGPSF